MSPDPSKESFPATTALTIGMVVLLLAVLPLLPPFHRLSGLHLAQLQHLASLPMRLGPVWTENAPSSLEANTGSKTAVAPKAKPAESAAGALQQEPAQTGASRYFFDPRHALNHFYDALAKTERKEAGAEALVLHYGDSPVTADSITADARSILQTRFGDAGHGFLLIAKPWAWYGHRGTEVRGKGWKIEPATQARARDGLHGLGGVSFTGSEGASSVIGLDADQSHLEVEYLEQPNGGTFKVSAEGQTLRDVSTEGPEKAPGFAEFDLPRATHQIELNVTSGSVRLFGYSFRRDQPGIIYSSLGLNGGQVQVLDRYFQVQQWTQQLQHQHPALLIFNYGTNESVFPAYIDKQYPTELREVLGRIQAALPDTSILVMSPMDRGQRDATGAIVTPPILPHIVDIQKQIALDMGCAFFDTYDAMGGAGTMGKWYNSQPRLVSADFMHPLPAGAAKVGTLLAAALTESYDRHERGPQVLATASDKRKP